MRRIVQLAATASAALALFALLPAWAGAHESRDVADGQYHLVVGFLNEPVAVGDKSGLDLRVSKPDPTGTPDAEGGTAGIPVEGLETTLQAEVLYGDQKMALTLEPRFGEPGAYAGWFYPNAAGTYAFHIFGTIEGVAIDETFTSGPDTFGDIEERLLFPPGPAASTGNTQGTSGAGMITTGGGFDGTLPGAIAICALFAVAATWLIRRERTSHALAGTATSRP
jgi:hypothetical protein